MVIAWQRNAARWRESQESQANCEGRYSGGGFVSGVMDRLLAYPGQSQVATAHEFFCACQNMANLRAQFAVGAPARLNCISAKKCSGNIAVMGTGLPGIKRLQGTQMQQG